MESSDQTCHEAPKIELAPPPEDFELKHLEYDSPMQQDGGMHNQSKHEDACSTIVNPVKKLLPPYQKRGIPKTTYEPDRIIMCSEISYEPLCAQSSPVRIK